MSEMELSNGMLESMAEFEGKARMPQHCAALCVSFGPSMAKELLALRRRIDWLAQAAANNGWQGFRVPAEDMIEKAKEAAQ